MSEYRINKQVGSFTINVHIESGKVSSVSSWHDPDYTQEEFEDLVHDWLTERIGKRMALSADGRGSE